MKDDVERLLPALRAGDRQAFIDLRHVGRGVAVHAIRSYIKCEQDVEEILADTWVRVHRKIHLFRGDSSLRTWIYRIAGNLAKNRYHYWNRRRRSQTLSLDHPVGDTDQAWHELMADEVLDQREQLAIEEIERAFRAALPHLNARHREIMLMLVDEHLTYEEISARIQRNVGTVKSRIGRARQELRRLMQTQLAAA